jgi:hypothetical protein
MRERTCGSDPVRQWRKSARVFKGIAWGDQPPHAVKLEAFEREEGCGEVRLMWRIKGPAEQADPHAGRMRGQEALGNGGFLKIHGRI